MHLAIIRIGIITFQGEQPITIIFYVEISSPRMKRTEDAKQQAYVVLSEFRERLYNF